MNLHLHVKALFCKRNFVNAVSNVVVLIAALAVEAETLGEERVSLFILGIGEWMNNKQKYYAVDRFKGVEQLNQ